MIVDGVPMVVPTVYGFDEQHLYLHGSVASQSLAAGDALACVTVTLVDGLVLARSVFEHAVNYRSAVIYARAADRHRPGGEAGRAAPACPSTWRRASGTTPGSRAARNSPPPGCSRCPLDEASVKIRTGPPDDGDSPDAALGLWAGELPLTSGWGEPVPDPALPPGIGMPGHVSGRIGTAAFPAGPAS